MIALLRNLTSMSPPVNGFDRLPPATETTEGADLARVKHYRNYLAHQDAPLIDNTFFTSAWKDLSDVSTRYICKLFKNHVYWVCLVLSLVTIALENATFSNQSSCF